MKAPPAPLQLDVRTSVRSGWVPSVALLRRWASAALGRRAQGAGIALLVVGPARSRALNRAYRGKGKPTNVLSFPAPPGPAGPQALLGDIVVCPAVLRREAREQGKRERDHFAHLFIHGVLHLVGHDHVAEADARRMEGRERRVLRSLGIADPYRPR